MAPVDNSVVSESTINFSWQPLEYADSYQLQVAQPSFENAILIVEDTTITITNFSRTLENGNYQWRIKAINFAYETPYSTQNLTIED